MDFANYLKKISELLGPQELNQTFDSWEFFPAIGNIIWFFSFITLLIFFIVAIVYGIKAIAQRQDTLNNLKNAVIGRYSPLIPFYVTVNSIIIFVTVVNVSSALTTIVDSNIVYLFAGFYLILFPLDTKIIKALNNRSSSLNFPIFSKAFIQFFIYLFSLSLFFHPGSQKLAPILYYTLLYYNILAGLSFVLVAILFLINKFMVITILWSQIFLITILALAKNLLKITEPMGQLTIASSATFILTGACFLLLKDYYNPIMESDVLVPKSNKKSFFQYRIKFFYFLVFSILCLYLSWILVADSNIRIYLIALFLLFGIYCLLFFIRAIQNMAEIIKLKKSTQKFKKELSNLGIPYFPGLFKIDDEGKITDVSEKILDCILKKKNIKAAKYLYPIIGTINMKLNLFLVNHILAQKKSNSQLIEKNKQYFKDNYLLFFKPHLVNPDDYSVICYLYSGADNKNLTIIHERNNLYKLLLSHNTYRNLFNKEYYKVITRLLERDDRYKSEEKALKKNFKTGFSKVISLFKKGSLPTDIQLLIKEAKQNNDIDLLKELYFLAPYNLETCLLIIQNENPKQLSPYKLDHYENTIRKFITDNTAKKLDFLFFMYDHSRRAVIPKYGISPDTFINYLKELEKIKPNDVYLSFIFRLLSEIKPPIFEKLLSHTWHTIESCSLLLKILDKVKSESLKRQINAAIQEITEEPSRFKYNSKNLEGRSINAVVYIAKIMNKQDKKQKEEK
jgi:hypothetical protein